MSHYAKLETQYKYKEELVECLEEIFGKGNVEYHEKPVHLVDYHGIDRPEVANLIVRRHHIDSASNDLGFVLENGSYRVIISDYDRVIPTGNRVLVDLPQSYVERVIKNRLPAGKYRVVTKEPGRIKLQVTR